MSNMFSITEITEINQGFKDFIESKPRDKRSNDQYIDRIKDYLRNQVLNRISLDSYEEIFSENNIIDFQQKIYKGDILRASLNHLKEYLIKTGKLEKGFEFNYIRIERKPINTVDFFDMESINNMFSDQIQYRNYSDKIITRCIIAISFFCIFEQDDIFKLEMADVLLEERLIKNKRADKKNPYLLKWITINDLCYSCISEYLNDYRNKIHTESESFFIDENGNPLSNNRNSINNMFNVFSSVANKKLVKYRINNQALNASMILYTLISSNGTGLGNILEIVEVSNLQWQKAFNWYLNNYISLSNTRGISHMLELELINVNVARANFELDKQMTDITLYIENNDESKNDFYDDINKYSEAEDISLNDVLDFDSMSKNNQTKDEVSIERLVRATKIARNLKEIYCNRCQLCDMQIRSGLDSYISEAHHLKPYNKIHKGDDTARNLIVLCPNCHSKFDNLIYAINPETMLVHCLFEDDTYHLQKLKFNELHKLGKEYLDYVWNLFLEKKESLH